MFFNKKLKQEIKQLQFNLEVQTKCHNDWFESWKCALDSKWKIEEELREVRSSLYASQVKVELLERKLEESN